MKPIDLTLYFITDSKNRTAEQLCDTVEKACIGGATLVQLREKSCSGRAYFELAKAVKIITDHYHVPLTIDDRVDIALAVHAAGVHIGAEDLPVTTVRSIVGHDMVIGATAKTVETALKAQAEGADYLGTGAIFPTTTKVKTILTDVAVLKSICNAVDIPVCAIGGLNYNNCTVLKGSGIAGMAVVSAIMNSADPEHEARRLVERIQKLTQ